MRTEEAFRETCEKIFRDPLEQVEVEPSEEGLRDEGRRLAHATGAQGDAEEQNGAR